MVGSRDRDDRCPRPGLTPPPSVKVTDTDRERVYDGDNDRKPLELDITLADGRVLTDVSGNDG